MVDLCGRWVKDVSRGVGTDKTRTSHRVRLTSLAMVEIEMNPGEGDDISYRCMIPSIAHPMSIRALGRSAKNEFTADLSKVAVTGRKKRSPMSGTLAKDTRLATTTYPGFFSGILVARLATCQVLSKLLILT